MLKFAANLSFLFTEAAFPDRFKLAADAGFGGVEYLFPYDYPAKDIRHWLTENKLQQVLFNLPPGDWAAGERGLACLPGREEEFKASLAVAAEYAGTLGCRRLHCMAGLRPAGIDELELEATYLANLRQAASFFAPLGIELLIEPINSRIDMPGYWLDDIPKAIRQLEMIAAPNVKLQLDLYHAQIMHGDLARTIRNHRAHIGHIQIADNPGRHEPGSGEINYPYLFSLLEQLAYNGWIGCEYKPQGETLAGLGWRPV
ncbi:MAG: hydroxypyruvate isomerase [Brachymonas sp.]|jgi:hydroxypyruvate isomerase|nr:hydroxypyruvate isomerase [Brachymonas sp.]MBP9652166.1 hydroxypyruvate isomerase [Brachymonas sp.]